MPIKCLLNPMPSGNLPGAAGTAANQTSASEPSSKLEVSFRFPSRIFQNSTKFKMLYLRQCVYFLLTRVKTKCAFNHR